MIFELLAKSIASCHPLQHLFSRGATHLPAVIRRLDRDLIPKHKVQSFLHQTLFHNLHHVKLRYVRVGEYSNLGLGSFRSWKLGHHVCEVHAYFASRMGAETEVRSCHLRNVG